MLDKQFELIYEQHCINVKLLTKEGYFAFFWQVLQVRGVTMREAYEVTEAELERQFDQTRYTSYESFINQACRMQRKLREQKRAAKQAR